MNIEEILALDDVRTERVPIPEWKDVTIRVDSMSATERAKIEKDWSGGKASRDPAGFRVDILHKTLKNDDGTPFGTPEQIKALMGKNGRAIERLFDTACSVSGFSDSDVKTIEKN